MSVFDIVSIIGLATTLQRNNQVLYSFISNIDDIRTDVQGFYNQLAALDDTLSTVKAELSRRKESGVNVSPLLQLQSLISAIKECQFICEESKFKLHSIVNRRQRPHKLQLQWTQREVRLEKNAIFDLQKRLEKVNESLLTGISQFTLEFDLVDRSILKGWQDIQLSEISTHGSFSDDFVVVDKLNDQTSPSPESEPFQWLGSGRRVLNESRLGRRQNPKSLAIDSCQWIFGHASFRGWLETPMNPCLWVSGAPGRGKTTLASVVLEKLRIQACPKTAVASYFFDGRYRDTTDTALHILYAIVQELLLLTSSQEHIRFKTLQQLCGILQTHKNNSLQGAQISASQLRYLVSDVIHKIEPDETLILVLDGLDEIKGSHERRLLNEILSLLRPYRPQHVVKTFICSRPTSECRNILSQVVHIDLDGEAAACEAAISYIRDIIQQTLPIKSTNGNYHNGHNMDAVHAFLQARSLFETLDLSNDSLSTTMGDIAIILAQPLEITYRQRLEAIQPQYRTAAERIFRWVTYAARPMSVPEISEALMLDSEVEVREVEISKICGNLIEVDNSGFVAFIHRSVRNFLVQLFEMEIEGKTTFSNSFRATNERLAHTCLKALSSSELLYSLCSQRDKLGLPDNKAGSSFVRYAQKHWKFHYGQSEGENSWLPGYLSSRLREAFEEQLLKFRSQYAHLQDKSRAPEHISPKILRSLTLRIGLRFSFVDLVKLELDFGADNSINDTILASIAGLPSNLTSNGRGESPMHMAAGHNSSAMIEMLLQHGADVNVKDSLGNSALHYAISHGNSAVVDLLLSHRAETGSHSPTSKIIDYWSYTITPKFHSCKICDEQHTYYVITKNAEFDVEMKEYPPFVITGNRLSEHDQSNGDIRNEVNACGVHGERNMNGSWTLKWLPGQEMYVALRLAAKRGWEDLNNLLQAAGVFDLEILMYKLRVS